MNVLLSLCQQELTTQMMMMMLPAPLPACLCPLLLPCLPAPLSKADGKTSAFTRLLMPHCGTLSNNCNKWTCPGRETAAPPALPLTLPLPLQLVHTLAPTSRGRSDCTVCRRCLHSLSRSLILPLPLLLPLLLLLRLLLPRRASLIKQNK